MSSPTLPPLPMHSFSSSSSKKHSKPNLNQGFKPGSISRPGTPCSIVSNPSTASATSLVSLGLTSSRQPRNPLMTTLKTEGKETGNIVSVPVSVPIPCRGVISNSVCSTRSNSPASDVIETRFIQKDYDPETGFKLINRYRIEGNLGRGVHGKVKLGKNLETGEYVAIKIVDRSQHKRLPRQLNANTLTPEQKIQREIAIFKKCAHPHVVKLMEVIDDPASRKIYMVLEYMQGGEIKWTNENQQPLLSVSEARKIFRDVLCGLEYLHFQGIIHRDIKPANLLLTGNGVVKISDFGVSHLSRSVDLSSNSIRKMIDLDLTNTAGSPAFFAPELCFSTLDSPLSSRPAITNAIDVWALGVTLYCFLYGRPPFMASNEYELFNVIPREPLSFPEPDKENGISEEACDPLLQGLLNRLLDKDPITRIKLREVKEHPWVVVDLSDPAAWRAETDPKVYVTVEVTPTEIDEALVTLWRDRLRGKLRKLSNSLSNIVGLRRRSKSVDMHRHSESKLNLMASESNKSEMSSPSERGGLIMSTRSLKATRLTPSVTSSLASTPCTVPVLVGTPSIASISRPSTPAGGVGGVPTSIISPLQLAPSILVQGKLRDAVDITREHRSNIGLGIAASQEVDLADQIEQDEIYGEEEEDFDEEQVLPYDDEDYSDNEGDVIEIRSRTTSGTMNANTNMNHSL